MNKVLNSLKIVFALLLFSQLAFSQTKPMADKRMSAAIAAYNNLKFAEAISILEPFLNKDSSNVEGMEMLANSYRLTKQYTQTLKWYEQLTKRSYYKPDWALRYAEALANNKQYEKSEQWYRKYLSKIPSDRRATLFSEADFDKLGAGVNWDLTYLNINTPASEYAPMLYKEGLIFSSNRLNDKPVKYVFAWNNTPFSDIYFAKDREKVKSIAPPKQDSTNKKKATSTKKIIYNDDNTSITSNDSKVVGTFDPKTIQLVKEKDKELNIIRLNDKINTKFHEGTSALMPDGSIMFTRNNFYNDKSNESLDGIIKLKMYTAKGFDLKEVKPFNHNDDQYSVGHPTISKDGKILVFSSDRPGGLGGVDLYYSIRLDETKPWSRPVNFGGKINSEGDEEFPYLDNFDKLYFSSNGWPGFGGLDMFYVEINDLKPLATPVNLGAPLNSPFDDFAIAKLTDSTGYVSSNRRGNDDIYAFTKKEFKIYLKARVLDALTKQNLSNAKLNLINNNEDEQLSLGDDGFYVKELSKNQGYELGATLPGYLPERKYLGTDGITKDSIIYVDLYLKKISQIQQYVINNCDSLKRKFSTGNIYYDLDKYEIRSDAVPTLDNLATLLYNYPDLSIITRSHCDSRASEAYNRTLSLNRGEAAKSYLISKGIAAERISVQYFGKSRLVNNCTDGVACSEEEQQRNRRTEFEIIYNGINLALIDCK